MTASRFAVLDPVEDRTLDVTSPVSAVMRDLTRPIADWVNNLTDASALSRENKRLLAENERLTNELVRSREDASELSRLRELEDVRSRFPEETFLAASIAARDSSNTRAIVAIDRGRSDGVHEGMIIVTAGHSLVGRVSKTFDDYSWVTLIIDPKSAVSAMVQESRAEGVVAGAYDGRLVMEFVGQGVAVAEGDFVVTSGVGGSYPPGIVIGRVADVKKADQDLFQQVHVEHLASLSKIEDVLVLTSFEQQTLERP